MLVLPQQIARLGIDSHNLIGEQDRNLRLAVDVDQEWSRVRATEALLLPDHRAVRLANSDNRFSVSSGQDNERVFVGQRVRRVAKVEMIAAELLVEIERPHGLAGLLVERVHLTDATDGDDAVAD